MPKATKRTKRSAAPALEPTMRSPAPDLGPRAQRTIERILDATRVVFLAKGYGGTTIDDIAVTAGISRASFYTYFPTKRDVLLALGSDTAEEPDAVTASFAADHPRRTARNMRALVDTYFGVFDRYGAFALAWTQAATEDEEIRVAGMHRHLHLCAELGRAVAGPRVKDPAIIGLTAYCMIERSWAYAQLYEDQIDTGELRDELARVLHRAYGSPRSRS
jgi:AcrR family transcriptional regulator